ncbi:MAG: VWA domain-containing protein [Phycisphaerales bacterium]
MIVESLQFAFPEALALLVLAPLIAWWSYRPSRRVVARYSSLDRIGDTLTTWRVHAYGLLPILRALALIVFVVALARPQRGVGEVRTMADGVAIELVVDRSWSMSYPMSDEDRTSRIEVVKRICREFVAGNGADLDGRPQDLIGVVVFGRFADTVCPLVRIHDTLLDLIDAVTLVGPQSSESGTAIGEGLALAAARLQDAENEIRRRNEGDLDPEFEIKSKIIVLMTDGDENVRTIPAVNAARLCEEWGIKIYAIGIGGGGGYVTVNTPLGERRIPVSTSYDETLLRRIAESTGGVFRAAESAEALRDIYEEIDALERTTIESREYTNYHEAFQSWVIAGAAFLLFELILATTVLRRAP